MSEIMTRAIRAGCHREGCSYPACVKWLDPQCKVPGRIRAAIEAMREPTFDPETVSYHEGMTRADWWRAMIDEALKP